MIDASHYYIKVTLVFLFNVLKIFCNLISSYANGYHLLYKLFLLKSHL